MPVAAAPAPDARAIRAAVRGRLEPGPELAALFDATLANLTPERWTIEWNLPHWLAARFELPRTVSDALVESNVLGLLCVRLTDDIADGDIAPEDAAVARFLAEAALDAALRPYRALFPPGSPFWSFFERSMATWRAGSDGPDHGSRAAPIKIAAHACCLLADRIDGWPQLDRCLDRAMTALVLYDHFFDWEADVEGGRWNAFVAGVVPGDPSERRAKRTRAAVLTAMLTREVVAEHFARIAIEADSAARLADALELDELAAYMRSWANAAAAQGEDVASHYRRAADRATRLLFPIAVGT